MKQVVFSRHARQQMLERGASEEEVVEAIETGERVPAKLDRVAYRRNFQFNRTWSGRRYSIKQVVPITTQEKGQVIVVTVYTFYF